LKRFDPKNSRTRTSLSRPIRRRDPPVDIHAITPP
jgi:hypothetical protein